MKTAQGGVVSSPMLEAAFRLATTHADLENANRLARDHLRDVVVVRPEGRPRRSAKTITRAVVARLYRLVMPAARPILSRWRQYSSSVIMAEVALLRHEVHALQAAHATTHATIEPQDAPPPLRLRTERVQRGSTRNANVQWILDDERMPHLNAAVEAADRKSGGHLTISGELSELGIAARELSDWLERTSIPADFGNLTIVLHVDGSRRDDHA